MDPIRYGYCQVLSIDTITFGGFNMTKKSTSLALLLLVLLSFIGKAENGFAIASIDREYIVRIFDSSDIASLNLGSRGQDAQSKNNHFLKQLEDAGIRVKDSFISESSCPEIYSLDRRDDFSETIASEIGFVFLVTSTSRDDLERALSSKGLYPDVIEPNYRIESSSLEESVSISGQSFHRNQRSAYSLINLVNAWNISTGSNSVKVAILDSGIDPEHVGLAGFIDGSLGRNFTDKGSPNDYFDSEGHGTHVAGVISSSGTTSGIMKQSTIVPLKVLDEFGKGNTFDLEKALLYSIELDVDIVNMSLGGPNKSSSLERTIQLAHDRGIIMVASAGNDGKGELYYPARFDPVISVGSVNSSGRRSFFSNYGQGLDIMAPGENIYSTLPRNRYGFKSGTSSSAPHVSGIIGLAKSLSPNLSSEDVRSMLRRDSNFTEEYGFGIIDAHDFLENLIYRGTRLDSTSVFDSRTTFDNLKSWTISFNMDLDETSVDSDHIYILSEEDHILPTTLSVEDGSVLVTPTKPYSYGETYSLYLSKDIASTSGHSLLNNWQFDFMVERSR